MTTTVTIQTAGHRVEVKTAGMQGDKTETLEMNRSRAFYLSNEIEIVGIRELPNEGALPQADVHKGESA